MKEALVLLANYNKVANKNLLDLLQNAPADVYTKDVGLHYKSIEGSLKHLINGEFFMIGLSLNKGNVALPACIMKEGGIDPEALKDFTTLRNTFEIVDDFILRVVSAAEHLKDDTKISFGEDISFNRPYYHLVMTALNHATHHRGEISAILDQLKIDNDINGMLCV